VSAVPFLPNAREEFLGDAERYDREVPGLGEEFIAEVEHAVMRIAAFPEHGSPYLAGTRRVVLGRFPYSVVYESHPDGLLIVAVAHQSRRPGYWRHRL
jgi:plasmid stabilization system protein ParE